MNWTKQDIKQIYNALSDAESKDIFVNRFLFSLTDNEEYMENVIKTTSEGKEFYEKIERADIRKVIFGAGFWGRSIARQYHKYGFDCFIDNNAVGSYEKQEGLSVISFEEYIKKYGNDAMFIVGSRLYYKDLWEQLIEHGISKERIVNAGKMIDDMSLRQYFDLPYMPHVEEEVFVDVGGFDGRTSNLFIQWCGNHYKRIYVFEPEKKNILQCEKNLLEKKAIYEIIPKGLWDRKCSLGFIENENGTSHISENADLGGYGYTSVEVDALDQLIDDHVTFIKMDIEGAEYKAIKGAEKIIRKHHPKLAISIYHNEKDIWELPQLIMAISPDYKLYLRHYSITQAETVLYAV